MPRTTPRRIARIAAPLSLAAALTAAAVPALAKPVTAEVAAELTCDDEVVVTVTEHAISNLVLVTEDGEVRIEDAFAGEELMAFVADVGELGEVAGVYVKAGNNGTRGKGNRGRGELVELVAPDCDPTDEPTDEPTDDPDGEGPLSST